MLMNTYALIGPNSKARHVSLQRRFRSPPGDPLLSANGHKHDCYTDKGSVSRSIFKGYHVFRQVTGCWTERLTPTESTGKAH